MSASSASPSTLPPAYPKSASDRDFSFGFRLSIFVHVGLILLLVVKSLIFPGKPMSYVPSLRVDIVGLPDQLKNEKINPPSSAIQAALKRAEADAKKINPVVTKTKEPVEKAAPDEMVLHPKQAMSPKDTKKQEKKLRSALDRIKALEKIEQDSDAPPSEHPSANLIKGNSISKGTSLSADARESNEASYFDLVRDRLQENWALPVWIARQNYSAQVQIYIDGFGRVPRMRFVKSSGNAQFDEAVKRTVTDSQPFARPPAEIAGSLFSTGVLIGFPL